MKRNKNVVTSFCFPVDKVDIIEKAEAFASARGISFSQLLVTLLEEFEQKNEAAHLEDRTPLAAAYTSKNMVLNESLDYWIEYARNEDTIEGLTHIFPKVKVLYELTNGKIRGLQTRK